MTLDDLVVVDLDGEVVSGRRASPTTEKDLHLATLRALPRAGRGDPHPRRLRHHVRPGPRADPRGDRGGRRLRRRRRARAATTGAPAPPRWATRWPADLADRGAALLANHGLVTCGPTPEKALHNAALVERTAKIVWGARAMGATIHPLPEQGEPRHGRRLPLRPREPVTRRCRPSTSDGGRCWRLRWTRGARCRRRWAPSTTWSGSSPPSTTTRPASGRPRPWAGRGSAAGSSSGRGSARPGPQRIAGWRAVYERVVDGTADAADRRVLHAPRLRGHLRRPGLRRQPRRGRLGRGSTSPSRSSHRRGRSP